MKKTLVVYLLPAEDSDGTFLNFQSGGVRPYRRGDKAFVLFVFAEDPGAITPPAGAEVIISSQEVSLNGGANIAFYALYMQEVVPVTTTNPDDSVFLGEYTWENEVSMAYAVQFLRFVNALDTVNTAGGTDEIGVTVPAGSKRRDLLVIAFHAADSPNLLLPDLASDDRTIGPDADTLALGMTGIGFSLVLRERGSRVEQQVILELSGGNSDLFAAAVSLNPRAPVSDY